MNTITTINPANGETLSTYALLNKSQIDTAIEEVYENWLEFRHIPIQQRSRWMHQASVILRENKNRLAKLATQEMGKVFHTATAEVEKCAWVCQYYAEHAKRFLTDEIIEADVRKSYVSFRPLGPVLAVMPWNYPYWQVFRFAAPA